MKMNAETKDWIKFISSIMLLVAGVVLIFISIYLPPLGEIHTSVLTVIGEILTFVGAVFGIGEYAAIQIAKINNKTEDKKED